MDVSISSCPFCGCENIFVGSSADIIFDNDYEHFACVCDASEGGCGATGGFAQSKEEAVSKWNKRCGKQIPVQEALTLRNTLTENDLITMRGLMQFNKLIYKFNEEQTT